MNHINKSPSLLRLGLLFLLTVSVGCAARHGTNLISNSPSPDSTPTPFVVSDAPVDTPTLSPPTVTNTSTPVPKRRSSRPVTVAFVGDILMGGSALPKLKKYGPDSFFVNVKTYLSQADLCVGNLEGPLGNEGQIYVDKKYTFLTPPEAAQGLLNAGFKILTLANNHSMDFGPEAMNSTLAALDALGLKHSGEGKDETSARQSAVVDIADRRIAVLAYSLTYPSEFWAGSSKPGCAQGDGYSIREDVSAARAAGADLVFVCIHWGQEGKTTLRGYQPSLARVALDAGADAVIGHHPHIWQALGVIHGKPVAYSLGNFVFGSYSAKVTRSGILYLTFDEDNRWTGGRVVPLNVHNGDVQFSPRPIAGVEGRKFADHLSTLSKPQGAKLRWDGKAVQWIAPQNN